MLLDGGTAMVDKVNVFAVVDVAYSVKKEADMVEETIVTVVAVVVVEEEMI